MQKHINNYILLVISLSILLVSPMSHGNSSIEHKTINSIKESKMINPNSSFPVLVVKDLNLAKSFYVNNFGFNIAFQNEWYLHLVSNSGIQVAFMLPNLPTQPNIFKKPFNGQGLILSLEVNNADLAYTYATNNSLDIALELKSEEWGQRHFAVKDPNGVYVDIVQATEPTEEYKAGYESK